ncbi:carbohydrate porin [Novosphingobium terrae]|uniref:carbohydrate porin n=1 Tax=Novosphingobium terrae TaxID=2726189 RepID=UPI00197F171A|nr:carbohydrate porin [Novosphingobium terrae]
MSGLKRLAALVAVGVAGCAPAAWAQEGAQDAAAAVAPSPSPLDTLAAKGIALSLSYTGEAASNLTGGLSQKTAYAGQVYAGVDLDMGKIAGVNGGTVHFAVTNRHGPSLSNIALGNNTSVQEIWGTQNNHLAILTYEQKLLGGALDIEAGKSQANIHFLNSSIYCNFQSNSTCGNPTMVFKDSNFTYFPASSWMAQAKLTVARNWFAHVGIYEVNPNRKDPQDNGFSLSFKGNTGFIVPFELGYGSTYATARLPRHVILGGWIDEGQYADPLRDTSGGIAAITGGAPLMRKGRSGLYLHVDQVLTRPDPKSNRGLAVFGVAMANVSGQVEESWYLDAGIVQTGTFKGRDQDTIGFMINNQHFSDLAMQRMNALRVAVGGRPNVARDEVMMELAYGAQLGRAVRISPNLQYILHPDQTGAPLRATAIPNAFIVGFKFTVDATKLLPH